MFGGGLVGLLCCWFLGTLRLVLCRRWCYLVCCVCFASVLVFVIWLLPFLALGLLLAVAVCYCLAGSVCMLWLLFSVYV